MHSSALRWTSSPSRHSIHTASRRIWQQGGPSTVSKRSALQARTEAHIPAALNPSIHALLSSRTRSKLSVQAFHSASAQRQPASEETRKNEVRKEDVARAAVEPKPAESQTSVPVSPANTDTPTSNAAPKRLSEDIYNLPNLLTISRLITCPIIGWQVLEGNMKTATALLFFSAITDLLDGWLARRWNSYTVFGSIADPAADKALMTVMVVTLGIKGLIPPLLATLIIGRDVGLILSALYIRYASLAPPKTFARYWDCSLPSASVQPTQISKYNTFLQLCLVGVSTVMPILSPETQELCEPALTAFQWVVAGTTIWSGASYVFGRGAYTYLNRKQ
ncbi:hypothetical protein V8E36_007318 [Tilletia maclaganii]